MENLKDILGRLLKANPGFEDQRVRLEVFEAWPRLVGERIARHCWPSRLFDDGTLLIAAESSSWLHSLHYLEAQIIEKYEKELGKGAVKALRFRMEKRPG